MDQLQTAETQQCNNAEDCLCDEARVRITPQEPLCAAITETYEVAFCEHYHVCTIFHQCHSQEAQVFQHLRADVEAEMALTVQEYIAVEQSRCLTGLIMEAMTPPRTPISHAALIACDDVDVSALNINFPCECTHHAGKYLAGHAAGDSTIMNCTGRFFAHLVRVASFQKQMHHIASYCAEVQKRVVADCAEVQKIVVFYVSVHLWQHI